MKLTTHYSQLFNADNRTAPILTARKSVNAYQLAELTKAIPDLPEKLQEHFEVEVSDYELSSL